MKEKPLEIWILSIIIFLYIILSIVMVRYFYLNYEIDLEIQIFSLTYLIIAILGAIITYGLLKAHSWIWTLAIFYFLIYIIVGSIGILLYANGGLIIIIGAASIILLNRKNVKKYLGKN